MGMQWLEKLGLVITNWKLQVVHFEWEGKKVMLKGNPALGRTEYP